MRVLALESSCDESAAAVLDERAGLLAHELFSQVELHRAYGGVVPELASRDHVRRLLPLVRMALERAGTAADAIDGVAYTAGPGLIGALLTGAALARSLAYAWGVPAIGVHHLEGHLLAPLLEPDPPPFPHVALLVSGGHTLLIEVGGVGSYRVLGASRDDAAGEAFDKSAKLLGLPYPGGLQLAQLAAHGAAGAFTFPRPMLDRPGLEFSFSGLKTAVLHAVRNDSELALGFLAASSQARRRSIDTIADLAFAHVLQRVAKFLMSYAPATIGMATGLPGVENLSQAQIAAAAGTVRDMAARALIRLKNAQAVELDRGRVRSIDRLRLEAFAHGVQAPPV